MNCTLTKPIFIIGAARSGTTLLGEILSQHSQLAYILEPKYIWRYGNAKAPDDLRNGEEWNEKVDKFIKCKFSHLTRKQNKNRMLEKTPSNCFRIQFIHKVFPDACFIHLLRDGRDVVLSAEQKWTSKPDKSALIRRLFSNEIPLSELHHYFFAFVRDVVGRKLFPEKGFLWGPQFSGMKKFRSEHTILETCAEQWKQSVCLASNHLAAIPDDQKLTIRYESLVADPQKVNSQLCEFLDLEIESLNEYSKTIITSKKQIRNLEDQKKIQGIMPIVHDVLKTLNYV